MTDFQPETLYNIPDGATLRTEMNILGLKTHACLLRHTANVAASKNDHMPIF